MSLKDDLTENAANTFKTKWERKNGNKIPTSDVLALGNNARDIQVTILYADISSSTELVNNYKDSFAAEIYKTFLYSCSRIIRDNSGEIRSFDGDRIMGIFIGSTKNSNAVKAALKINDCVKNIIQVEMDRKYNTNYKIKHTCGIDTSKIMSTRTGIRGNNDISWIGRSANYAAGLNSLSDEYSTWITASVYEKLHESSKFDSAGKNMWVKDYWKRRKITVYKSTYLWNI